MPEVASFAAGQAAFTMMVLIVFNLIHPTGWQVGLIRVEDIVVGGAVGVVVSLLLWPRGSATRSRRPSTPPSASVPGTCAPRSRGSPTARPPVAVSELSYGALTASRTVDDAVRQYLSESGGPADHRAPVVRRANRAIRAARLPPT